MQSSKKGVVADIWKSKISPYPENLIPFTITRTSLINRLSSRKLAFVSDIEELMSLLQEDCRLHISKTRAYGASLAFAVQKDAPFKKDFDRQ